MRLICKAFKERELLKVGNRSYLDAFRYPESCFDSKDLMTNGGSPADPPIAQPLRDPGKLFTDQVLIPPSQLVFLLAGKTYRKSGMPETAGQIAGGLTDASTVIQAALNSLTSGRTRKEKVVLKGDFSINAEIVLKSYTILDLKDAKLTLANGVNNNMLRYEVKATYVDIFGGILNGNCTNQTAASSGITDNGVDPVYRNKIIGVKICEFHDMGIKLALPYLSIISQNEIHDNLIDGVYINNHADRDKSSFNDIFGNHRFGLHIAAGSGFQSFGDSITGNWQNGLVYAASHGRFIGLRVQDNGTQSAGTYSNIKVKNSYNVFIAPMIPPEYEEPYPSYDYEEYGTENYNTVKDAIFMGSQNGMILERTNWKFINNIRLIYYPPPSYAGVVVFTENSGTATFNGTGAQTAFTFAHGLAYTPTHVNLEAKTADASGVKYWSADTTNITVTFITAPPAGIDNVVIGWKGEV